MRGLVLWSARNPLFAILIGLMFVGFGVMAARSLPIDAVPDVTNVQVQVVTRASSLSATEVEAQMAGSVWKIERAVGDRVSEEDVILVIESMKMEIPVEAPCSGTLTEIRVAEGDAVEEGAILAVID